MLGLMTLPEILRFVPTARLCLLLGMPLPTSAIADQFAAGLEKAGAWF